MPISTSRTRPNVLTLPTPNSTTRRRPTFTHDDIAVRAFELYCERGRQDGHDVEDWLRAERELRAQTTSKSRRIARRRHREQAATVAASIGTTAPADASA